MGETNELDLEFCLEYYKKNKINEIINDTCHLKVLI